MNKIKKICKKNKLFLIEDCAEAFGSYYRNKHVGTFGDVSTFSFFGSKTITTGEGGMVLFKYKKHFELGKLLRDHGMSNTKRYWHDLVGYNYRMTNMQAAIGLAQMDILDKVLNLRKNQINHFLTFSLSKNREH